MIGSSRAGRERDIPRRDEKQILEVHAFLYTRYHLFFSSRMQQDAIRCNKSINQDLTMADCEEACASNVARATRMGRQKEKERNIAPTESTRAREEEPSVYAPAHMEKVIAKLGT